MQNLNMSKLVLVVAAMMAAGGACAADTASGTGTMAVSATVAAECAVGQSTAIAFGGLSMIVAGLPSTVDDVAAGTMSAICTNGTSSPKLKYTSLNVSAGVFRLKGVTDATAFIPYTLYQDATAAGTAVVNNTPTVHSQFTATGAAQTLDLSAKILAANKSQVKVQAYSDTITVTTSFDA